MVINMGKYTVYAYDAEIELGGETYSVLLGIEEEGHPSHAYEDSWCDNKIYYYMTIWLMGAVHTLDATSEMTCTRGDDFCILYLLICIFL